MASHWETLDQGEVIASDTPEKLWRNATAYFKFCDETPITTKRAIMAGSKAGNHATEEYNRPYTIKGLCMHCGIDEDYILEIKRSKDRTSLWYGVVLRILYVIHTQNLEGALVGLYSPTLVKALLAIDTVEEPPGRATIEIIDNNIPQLANSENEVLEMLEQELAKVKSDYIKDSTEQFGKIDSDFGSR